MIFLPMPLQKAANRHNGDRSITPTLTGVMPTPVPALRTDLPPIMPKSSYRAGSGIRGVRLANLAVFGTLIVAVCLLGGASRHDVLSLILLRPLAVLALGYALLAGGLPRGRACVPFVLLVALILLMIAQLVPLPPGVWSTLPGREAVAQLDGQLGIAGTWRPLSLAPGRTVNSLFALSVPLAIFLLYRIQEPTTKSRIVWLIVALGVASMAWGMLQLAGGGGSFFYTYRIHTDDRPIGFFANRNHQAIFIALTILFAGILMDRALRQGGQRVALTMTALAGYVVLALAFEFILGSRGGLLLATMATVAIALTLAFSPAFIAKMSVSGSTARASIARLRRPWLLVGAFGVGLTGLFALAASLNRNEALARMWSSGDTARYDRVAVLPYLARMVRDQFPFGSGFGSFDALFRTYEIRDFLTTFYLNQAHNDWLQLLIEGGLVAGAIAVAFVVWVGAQAVRLRGDSVGLLLVGVLGALAFASIFDYPLRVPILMAVCVLTVCSLADREPGADTFTGGTGRVL